MSDNGYLLMSPGQYVFACCVAFFGGFIFAWLLQ